MDEYTPTTEQMRDFVGGVVQAEFDRWLTAHDRVVAANAWDEGAKSASPDWYWHDDGKSENPYRITEED